MDSLKDLLQHKADDWDGSGLPEDIRRLQTELDKLTALPAQVKGLDGGVVFIVTKSSSVASDIRLQQTLLVERFNDAVKQKVTRIRIRIQ